MEHHVYIMQLVFFRIAVSLFLGVDNNELHCLFFMGVHDASYSLSGGGTPDYDSAG